MRNHCEPVAKQPDAATAIYTAPWATRSLHLPAHGPPGNNGGRPPMQKSFSTRSFAKNKRSLMYRGSSSRSMSQRQTVAEDVQLVEGRPAYIPVMHRVQSKSMPRQGSISPMTVSYQRRSSKSIFSSDDDEGNLSDSEMGSVMSFDRDDESKSSCNYSVVSGKSMTSRLSTALSRTSKSFRGVGKKLMKPLGLSRRNRSDADRISACIITDPADAAMMARNRSSDETTRSARSPAHFLATMLAKRGTSKQDVEPWRALASDSPSYWADRVDDCLHSTKLNNNNNNKKPVLAATAIVAAAIDSSRRIKHSVSM
jgi:hypothetical protein